jgi:hypothetical protein
MKSSWTPAAWDCFEDLDEGQCVGGEPGLVRPAGRDDENPVARSLQLSLAVLHGVLDPGHVFFGVPVRAAVGGEEVRLDVHGLVQ